jgi:hypothetical protein
MREKMNTEKNQRTRHKNPKFKDSDDENFSNDDVMEMQQRRKKLGKRSQWKNTDKEKW